jgi:hypothetical protein
MAVSNDLSVVMQLTWLKKKKGRRIAQTCELSTSTTKVNDCMYRVIETATNMLNEALLNPH